MHAPPYPQARGGPRGLSLADDGVGHGGCAPEIVPRTRRAIGFDIDCERVRRLVVFESTALPGCTEEDWHPSSSREHSASRLGTDFAVATHPAITPGANDAADVGMSTAVPRLRSSTAR